MGMQYDVCYTGYADIDIFYQAKGGNTEQIIIICKNLK